MSIRVDVDDLETDFQINLSVGSPTSGANDGDVKIESYSTNNTGVCKQKISKKCPEKAKKSCNGAGAISAMSALDTSGYGPVAQKYLPKKGHFEFGIHFDNESKGYKIGKVPMAIQTDDILVKYEEHEVLYRGTVGLWRLLSQDMSYFNEEFYFNDEDWVVYMEILMRTNPADCANDENEACEITPFSYEGGNQGAPHAYQGAHQGAPHSYQGGNQGISAYNYGNNGPPSSCYGGGNQGVNPQNYGDANQGISAYNYGNNGAPTSCYGGGNQGVNPQNYGGANQGISAYNYGNSGAPTSCYGGGNQGVNPQNYGGANQGISAYNYGNNGASSPCYGGGNQGVSAYNYGGGNQGGPSYNYGGCNKGITPYSYQGGNQGYESAYNHGGCNKGAVSYSNGGGNKAVSSCKYGGGNQNISSYNHGGGNQKGYGGCNSQIAAYSYGGGNKGVAPYSYEGGNKGSVSYGGCNKGVVPYSYGGGNKVAAGYNGGYNKGGAPYHGGNAGVTPYQGGNAGITPYSQGGNYGISAFNNRDDDIKIDTFCAKKKINALCAATSLGIKLGGYILTLLLRAIWKVAKAKMGFLGGLVEKAGTALYEGAKGLVGGVGGALYNKVASLIPGAPTKEDLLKYWEWFTCPSCTYLKELDELLRVLCMLQKRGASDACGLTQSSLLYLILARMVATVGKEGGLDKLVDWIKINKALIAECRLIRQLMYNLPWGYHHLKNPICPPIHESIRGRKECAQQIARYDRMREAAEKNVDAIKNGMQVIEELFNEDPNYFEQLDIYISKSISGKDLNTAFRNGIQFLQVYYK
ncbi:uncharacterized protein LOC111063867 [Nilaparvata lugens]|uniref:uncharacterized protein LOC111063867 n=1 Tax=Nilaparvata lugens TaxID=108931 RepID=UPI00193E05EE|nr:uncharacterized protein LOC111063867 [Nilaparvata lugens]